MDFIKKNLSNLLFFAFIIFLFTPLGLPVRAFLIKGMSFVTTRVFNMEIDKNDRVKLNSYDWQLIDAKGEFVNFKQFENKVVLVNFWATWCPPCVAEMPGFQDLYDDYKDKIVFLFVANDSQERVESYINKKGFNIPVYYQNSASPKEMTSSTIPTTYILNKKGEIVVNKSGAADWDSEKVRNMIDRWIK